MGTFAKAVDYELFAGLSVVQVSKLVSSAIKDFVSRFSFFVSCPKRRFLILSTCFRVDLFVLLCYMSWPLRMIVSFISMTISAGKVHLILHSRGLD